MEKKKDNPSLSLIYSELLDIKAQVSSNSEAIDFLTNLFNTLSTRQWFIVTGIIVTVLLQILFFYLSRA